MASPAGSDISSANSLQINASSLFDFPFYNPGASGAGITCPVRLIAAEQDTLCPYPEVQALARKSHLVDLLPLPCSGYDLLLNALHFLIGILYPEHFDLYPGTEVYERSMTAMKEFLSQHVPL